MTEFKINPLILLLEPPFQMIIKQQANYAKVPVVSEFTYSFSFTPSSELYEWTNVGNEGIDGDFGYSLTRFHSLLPVNFMSGLM